MTKKVDNEGDSIPVMDCPHVAENEQVFSAYVMIEGGGPVYGARVCEACGKAMHAALVDVIGARERVRP